MFPEAGPGRTAGSMRIPVGGGSSRIPEGGWLELAIPRGNCYPSEPPLLVFTHPSLSVAAKRFVIQRLYAKAWEMQNESLGYELHSWLSEGMHAMLLEYFRDEITALDEAAVAVAAEKIRREKEGTKEFQAKKAQLARKEAERLEAAEREQRRSDKEYAARKAKEEAAAGVVVSKRIGGLVNVIGKLRAQEEEEDAKRVARIAQIKAMMEAEERGDTAPNSEAAATAQNTDSTAASAESKQLEQALAASLTESLVLDSRLAGDDALCEEKDSLEILQEQDDPLQSPNESAIVPPAPMPSAQSQRLNASLAAEWSRTQQSAAYLKILEKRRTLPAFLMKQQVMQMILSKQVIVISGSTGCGKSTQCPQFILDQAIESGAGASCSIICTQPRRLAAIAVAERVATERAERIGDTVGYSIRLESKRSSRTRLLFCTTGVILRHLESSPDLAGVSHVIVDEVHERSLDSDFLLIILKGLLARRPDLKLILMSATLNADVFTNYFATQGSATIDIPGRAFPVRSLYMEDIIEATRYELDDKSEYARKEKKKGGGGGGGGGGDASSSSSSAAAVKELQGKLGGKRGPDDEVSFKLQSFQSSAVSSSALQALTRIDPLTQEELSYSPSTLSVLERLDPLKINYELLSLLVRHIVTSGLNNGGSILVFLSGMAEISTAIKEMRRDEVLQSEARFRILPLHSLLSSAEQSRVFETMRPGVTKIVLSTNLAETSLTIEDVTVVIDSGKMKEMQYNSTNGMSQLMETNVSQANARQRAGRAGRVREGLCFFMYTAAMSRSLPAQQLPEMLRAPLEQLALRIKSLNLGSISSFLSRAIEPPSAAAIEHVVKVLRDYNALEAREEVLTPLGFHLATLPVDARIGKMLIFAAIFRCLDPVLTIAASMSVRSPFSVPFEKREEADEIKRKFCPYQSDHLTLLAAYDGWRVARARGRSEERSYASRNFLSLQTLTMIDDMKKQMAVLLGEIGFIHRRNRGAAMDPRDPVNQHAHNTRLIEAVIVAGCYPHIARLEANTDPRGGGGDRDKKGGKERSHNGGRPRWVTREGDVAIHPSSVLFHENDSGGGFDSPYLVYHEMVKTTKIYIRDATVVGAYALLLFGVDMDIQADKSLVLLDDWLSFKIKPRTAALLSDLRLELRKILVEKIQCPSVDIGSSKQEQQQQQRELHSEESESRMEARKVIAPAPASALLPASAAASDPTSGLSSSVSPGLAAIKSAPDLISVVALLLAEEDKQRRMLREKAAASFSTPATGGVIAAVQSANGPSAAASTSITTGVPSSSPPPVSVSAPVFVPSQIQQQPTARPPPPQQQPQRPQSQRTPQRRPPQPQPPPQQQSPDACSAEVDAESAVAPAAARGRGSRGGRGGRGAAKDERDLAADSTASSSSSSSRGGRGRSSRGRGGQAASSGASCAAPASEPRWEESF